MKKFKWLKRKEWYGHSYSLYLPETAYLIGKIMTRIKTKYDIALPKKDGDSMYSSLSDAKSDVRRRLLHISKDLQNLLQ